MHSQLVNLLNDYRTKQEFNSSEWVNVKCKKLSEYLSEHRLTGTVVSVSGGVDSAVTLALCLETMKRYPYVLKKVVPLAQPIHSSDWALNRAKELCDTLNVKLTVVNQTEVFNTLKDLVDTSLELKGDKYASGQLKSYMRTPVNYYVAQLMTQEGYPSVVMGTGNKDEDCYLAYFCKAGDGVVDVQLISDLHKSQVFTVGKELGVPESILTAPPSADLWDGQSDENEMEISYDAVELFIGYYLSLSDDDKSKWESTLDDDARSEWDHIKRRCVIIHNKNKHKLGGIVNL